MPIPIPPSWLRAMFPTDHKTVARCFLVLGTAWLFLGGALAMAMRWSLAYPGRAIPLLNVTVSPAGYPALFTLHGTVMVFFAVTPWLIQGLGGFLVPLQVGARRVAFPRLGTVSLGLFILASVVLLASVTVPLGTAASGWTAYPPLSTPVGSPGAGQTLWLVALVLASASTLLGAVNTLATLVGLRAPGMGFFRLPLASWGFFLTAVLNALFVPVLLAAGSLLLCDRLLGTRFFVSGMFSVPGSGDPLVYQHLFWMFGHPEVYILILPVWGITTDLLACHSRRPAAGYRATALSMCAVTALSSVVYGHHLFAVGLGPMLSRAFMALTMVISVPSSVFFLNWLATLRNGSLRATLPMGFSLGVVLVFALGGLTGLPLAAVSTDIYLHDSYFVVGHFHLVMAAALLLGAYAAVYQWFPKVTGRSLHPGLGWLHLGFTLPLLLLVFGAMLLLGWAGMPRRLYDPSAYTWLAPLRPLQRGISYAAFVLGAAQLVFLANVSFSLFRGPRAGSNPWGATTLEWTVASPPPSDNFAIVPTVLHGPHEYARTDHPDRDWLSQDEPSR